MDNSPSEVDNPADLHPEDSIQYGESTVYAKLPAIFKNRIPRIPSIRASVSAWSNRTPSNSRRWSGESFLTQTPPPGYATATASEVRLDGVYSDDDSEQACSNYSSLSGSSTPITFSQPEVDSGVQWKFARQGINLLNLASQEAAALPAAKNRSCSFIRRLYIDSITYLLQGLPVDLTVEERLKVWNSLPNEVTELSSIHERLVQLDNGDGVGEAQAARPQPSILQRSVSWTIVQIFLLAQFLIPYVQLFMTYAYQYEREHRIADKLVRSSINTADQLVRRGAQLVDNVGQMSQGRAGQALNEFAIWWIRGVTAGIHDGVNEGMMVIGADGRRPRAASSRSRKS